MEICAHCLQKQSPPGEPQPWLDVSHSGSHLLDFFLCVPPVEVSWTERGRGVYTAALHTAARKRPNQRRSTMQSSWVLFLVSTLARCGLSLPVTPADQSIELILGNGCFFEQQYTAVQFEISHLRRTPQQITAVTGYAGGRKVLADLRRCTCALACAHTCVYTMPVCTFICIGTVMLQKQEKVPGDLCYHNAANVKDYGKAGFAEAVQLSVPSSSIGAAFVSWFGSMWAEFDVGRFARRDFYDVGAEYRAIVAFPSADRFFFSAHFPEHAGSAEGLHPAPIDASGRRLADATRGPTGPLGPRRRHAPTSGWGGHPRSGRVAPRTRR